MSLLDDIFLRAALDGDDAFVSCDEFNDWPADARAALLKTGIVQPAQPATSVVCDACADGHVEVPELVETPGGLPRAYIPCPAYGRTGVDLARLKRWRCEAEAIANVATELFGLALPAASFNDLGWRLGLLRLAGMNWQVFVLRRSAPEAKDALRPYRRAMVLALSEPYGVEGTLVLAAAKVLRISDTVVECDWPYLEAECTAIGPDRAPIEREDHRAGGRRGGRTFGALIDCWFTCGRLGDRFESPQQAYDFIEGWFDSHALDGIAAPSRGQYGKQRSYAASHRPDGKRCAWHDHPAPLPSQ